MENLGKSIMEKIPGCENYYVAPNGQIKERSFIPNQNLQHNYGSSQATPQWPSNGAQSLHPQDQHHSAHSQQLHLSYAQQQAYSHQQAPFNQQPFPSVQFQSSYDQQQQLSNSHFYFQQQPPPNYSAQQGQNPFLVNSSALANPHNHGFSAQHGHPGAHHTASHPGTSAQQYSAQAPLHNSTLAQQYVAHAPPHNGTLAQHPCPMDQSSNVDLLGSIDSSSVPAANADQVQFRQSGQDQQISNSDSD